MADGRFVAVYARHQEVRRDPRPSLPAAAAFLLTGADEGHCVALRIEDASGSTVLDCDSQQRLQVIDLYDAGDEAKWTDPAWWANVTS